MTLEHLNGAYKVEDGDGQERDPYLKEHGVITYLVVNPKVLYLFDSCTQIPIRMGEIKRTVLDVCPGGALQPTAPLPDPTHTVRSQDESICPDDPLSGVLGGSQTFRQSAPPGQHD